MTHDELKAALDYNQETGKFIWRSLKVKNQVKIGDQAGSISSGGYIVIEVNGKTYAAHRLAWLYMTGEMPERDIDHEDTNPQNNKWTNLRLATKSQNMRNQKRAHKNNKCGLLGVYFDRSGRSKKRWRSCIRIDGRTVSLGRFSDPESAHIAYLKAKVSLHSFDVAA